MHSNRCFRNATSRITESVDTNLALHPRSDKNHARSEAFVKLFNLTAYITQEKEEREKWETVVLEHDLFVTFFFVSFFDWLPTGCQEGDDERFIEALVDSTPFKTVWPLPKDSFSHLRLFTPACCIASSTNPGSTVPKLWKHGQTKVLRKNNWPSALQDCVLSNGLSGWYPFARSISPCLCISSVIKSAHCRLRTHGLAGFEMSAQWTIIWISKSRLSSSSIVIQNPLSWRKFSRNLPEKCNEHFKATRTYQRERCGRPCQLREQCWLLIFSGVWILRCLSVSTYDRYPLAEFHKHDSRAYSHWHSCRYT